MAGRLIGIARHDRPKGPMETIAQARVSAAEGVHGDFRGALAATKPDRKRQVTVLEACDWRAALDAIGQPVEWHLSRRNFLIDGVRLPHERGTRVQFGESMVIEVTGECDPCHRMDALCMGLFAAMKPDWRGGFTARVIADGRVSVGDPIRII